jgi:putative SOS response-associated peptidase YedK
VCGRFSLIAAPEQIAEHFELDTEPVLAPRFNIAPSQPVATVFQATGDAPRALALRRWGLIPSWAQDAKIGNRQINARSETLAEKPAFRKALSARRCLIPADGFYEWSGPSRSKQPHYIALGSHAVFGFAGLWERWHDPQGEVVESCTVITTQANALLSDLHHRMPVILDPGHYADWLDPDHTESAQALALLGAEPCEALQFGPVSYRVNDVNCDDASCLDRVETQPTLF